MDFFLFCLLNAVLFLRPAELVPALIGLPIYQCLIILCVIVSYESMVKKLQPRDLLANPINLCVLGMLIAVPLSHLRHFNLWSARYSFMDFSKTALYYLIFVAVIRSERRLEQFFKVIFLLLAFMASLSLLHEHGLIRLPQLDSLVQRGVDRESGELIPLTRLRGVGIFNDPNDLAMILVVGLALGVHMLVTGNILTRPIWLTIMAAMAYAIVLTKSRGGGFLPLFAAVGAFAYARWGWKRAAAVGVLMLPVVAAGFALRNDGDIESGTGQSRIQLWSQGISLMKSTPIFGIGFGEYDEEVGHVAHNSFVQCYVELGFVGGTFFFGCFYFALLALTNQSKQPEILDDVTLWRRTTVATTIVTGAAVAMLTLSRGYTVPVFMILGIGSATIHFNAMLAPETYPPVDRQVVRKLVMASGAFFIATYVFMRTMVRWG